MSELNKNNPFKTPQDYFEGFNNALNQRLHEKEPLLPNDGFVVPDGYFDSLHKNIATKITAKEPKRIRLHTYRNYYWAAASIAAIIMVITYGLWQQTAKTSWNSLASSDIESYFETNTLGLSTYEIAEMIPLDELEVNDILSNNLNEENVIDYLNENINDFEELNLEDYE